MSLISVIPCGIHDRTTGHMLGFESARKRHVSGILRSRTAPSLDGANRVTLVQARRGRMHSNDIVFACNRPAKSPRAGWREQYRDRQPKHAIRYFGSHERNPTRVLKTHGPSERSGSARKLRHSARRRRGRLLLVQLDWRFVEAMDERGPPPQLQSVTVEVRSRSPYGGGVARTFEIVTPGDVAPVGEPIELIVHVLPPAIARSGPVFVTIAPFSTLVLIRINDARTNDALLVTVPS